MGEGPLAVRALLVGNSTSLMGAGLGEYIDSFDTVVRFNGGNPSGNPEDLGGRTTYWSFSTLNASDYERWRIPGAVPMCLNMRIDYPVFISCAVHGDKETYQSLIDGLGHPRPSTGLITANHISQHWECDLYAIGFDFFANGTWYRGGNNNIPHNGDLEKQYMKRLGVQIL